MVLSCVVPALVRLKLSINVVKVLNHSTVLFFSFSRVTVKLGGSVHCGFEY